MFSASEAEELVEVIICLFLDRQLQGLSVLLYECMQALIIYFTDREWKTSCEKIAKYLASRLAVLLLSVVVMQSITIFFFKYHSAHFNCWHLGIYLLYFSEDKYGLCYKDK